MIPPTDITGLLLAGGQGLRMGGVDKGLEAWRGQPLALRALQRLRGQVGPLLISANRNAEAYAALGGPGVTVVADAPEPGALSSADGGGPSMGHPAYAGPLAGLLAGLSQTRTPWLAAVPCDAPRLPHDLVERLAQAAGDQGAEAAMACTQEGGIWRPQPVFCLLSRGLQPRLAAALAAGHRKVGPWLAAQRCVQVPFDDAAAFFNANTLADLQAPPPAP